MRMTHRADYGKRKVYLLQERRIEMTNEELRELYSHCIYCELDDDVEKELSEWELNEVFIPIIEEV